MAWTGGGGAKELKAWRSWEKNSEEGGSGTVRNSPGRHSVVPKTISAAERPIPSLGVVRSPSRTQGSCWFQEPSTHRALREFFMLRWNLSTIPLLSGW